MSACCRGACLPFSCLVVSCLVVFCCVLCKMNKVPAKGVCPIEEGDSGVNGGVLLFCAS